MTAPTPPAAIGGELTKASDVLALMASDPVVQVARQQGEAHAIEIAYALVARDRAAPPPAEPTPERTVGVLAEAVDALNLLSDWLTRVQNESDDTDAVNALLRLNGDSVAITAKHLAALSPHAATGGEAEQALMVCPQCEGEGHYADGVDEAACSTPCARCGSNGWIVDLATLSAPPATGGEAVALSGISLAGMQGEPAGMMTVTAHFSDGSERCLIRDNGTVISHWKNASDLATPVPAPGVGEVVEALRPFAGFYEKLAGLSDGVEVRVDASFDVQGALAEDRGIRLEAATTLAVGDFHRAAQALSRLNPDEAKGGE